ncbi:Protein disulfide-isomerase [Bertholletia excelsa]
MRNLGFTASASSPSWNTLLALTMASLLPLILFLATPSTVVADSQSSSGAFQWQTLTKHNFSTQIRLHPHLLLMVTVPWSGESRSLMKDLAELVADKQEMFGGLRLMLLYRNTERMLADAIGATEGITILCYHHSLSFKYQGRLRAETILSSAHYLMSLPPDYLPLESLKTSEELQTFLQSTDKGLLLLEFCGWTHSLLAKAINNGTETAFGINFGADFTDKTNVPAEEKKNQKGMENEKMLCGVEDGISGIPWLGEFGSAGAHDLFGARNMRPATGISCSFKEFQQFDTFFSKFTTTAREFFLPPEKLRFGLVSERSLLSSMTAGDSGSWLSSLGLGDSFGSWSVILYFPGCPNCSKVLKEGDDLRGALQIESSLVTELTSEGNDAEPILPANKPSIILFVDRSSNSMEIKIKSKEALEDFRNLALHHQKSRGVSKLSNAKTDNSLRRLVLKPSPASHVVEMKDKVSFMLIDEEKHAILDKISSGIQGNSLQEILAYIIQQRDKVKMSSLAKEAGFQLLSDDFDIRIQALPAQKKVVQSDQVQPKPIEDLPETSVGSHEDQVSYLATTSSIDHEGQYKVSDTDESSQYPEEKTISDASISSPGVADHFQGNPLIGSAEDRKLEQKNFPGMPEMGGFVGSFFFSDGDYQLLRALTGGSNVPSVVIVDPILHQHYVLPEEAVFSYFSVSDFLDRFLNGSLLPYQRSESLVTGTRETPCPPFVNMDFHEVDAIPRVNAHNFSKLVIGFNYSDGLNSDNAWTNDVLVLFSNSWCGFCQRMEVVVREVYRAVKHYATMLETVPRNETSVLTADDSKHIALKLPQIYLLDCTLNECSLILKSVAQREIYPSLLLFPAERKNAVSYKGDVAVLDVIKFIADNGNNVFDLVKDKGILHSELERGNRKQCLREDIFQHAVPKVAYLSKDKYHEVLLRYRSPERVVGYNQVRPHKSNGVHGDDATPQYQVIVGSFLIATVKLLNVHPFDKSKILIVKADPDTGFQGLIMNKHISWDSLHELEEGTELLREARLSFGGPLLKHGMPLVALTRRNVNDHYPEVLPSVYFLDQQATIHEIEGLKLHKYSIADYWFFLGYSSWGWEQLCDEIAQGAWNISNNTGEQLDWPWS